MRLIAIVTIIFMLYVFTYVITNFLKLNYAMTNDGFNVIFSRAYRPVMEVHARITQSSPHSGLAIYNGSNTNGDKIFFTQDGQVFGGYKSMEFTGDKTIAENEKISIVIKYRPVESSDDFRVYRPWNLVAMRIHGEDTVKLSCSYHH